ncbi:hypothetical protein PENTCL1PPCAC_24850, partial [Pristionchus entomophagus]
CAVARHPIKMILRSLFLLLHAVMTLQLEFESCEGNSVCIVHTECIHEYLAKQEGIRSQKYSLDLLSW